MMGDYLYQVLEDGKVLAADMELENAMIFVKALFDKYWGETSLSITIQREPLTSECDEEATEYDSH